MRSGTCAMAPESGRTKQPPGHKSADQQHDEGDLKNAQPYRPARTAEAFHGRLTALDRSLLDEAQGDGCERHGAAEEKAGEAQHQGQGRARRRQPRHRRALDTPRLLVLQHVAFAADEAPAALAHVHCQGSGVARARRSGGRGHRPPAIRT